MNITISFKCAKCSKLATVRASDSYQAARYGLLIGMNKLMCVNCMMKTPLDTLSALVSDLPFMKVTGDL